MINKNYNLDINIDVVNIYVDLHYIMNIQQFQYVLAVVELKKFGAAAERCFITQSTLSTMIGRFENEIGIKIFNRKTKPVSITSEGKQVIDRLRIIVNEVESLENIIQELKGEMVGELKIGIIPTVTPYLLPLFLEDFARKFPKVKIHIKEITTSQIQIDLKMRMLDIGILALPLNDDKLTELELYSEPFLVYDCSEKKNNSKISVNNLDFSKLLLLQEGHCLRSQAYKICELYNQKCQSNKNFMFDSGSMDSLLRFTRSSKGITIIPYLASIDLTKEERQNLVEFNVPTPARSIGLLTHNSFVKKRMLKELQKIIQESVLELMPEIKKSKIIKPN